MPIVWVSKHFALPCYRRQETNSQICIPLVFETNHLFSILFYLLSFYSHWQLQESSSHTHSESSSAVCDTMELFSPKLLLMLRAVTQATGSTHSQLLSPASQCHIHQQLSGCKPPGLLEKSDCNYLSIKVAYMHANCRFGRRCNCFHNIANTGIMQL